jgi:hypothetical protein
MRCGTGASLHRSNELDAFARASSQAGKPAALGGTKHEPASIVGGSAVRATQVLRLRWRLPALPGGR